MSERKRKDLFHLGQLSLLGDFFQFLGLWVVVVQEGVAWAFGWMIMTPRLSVCWWWITSVSFSYFLSLCLSLSLSLSTVVVQIPFVGARSFFPTAGTRHNIRCWVVCHIFSPLFTLSFILISQRFIFSLGMFKAPIVLSFPRILLFFLEIRTMQRILRSSMV